MKITLNFDFRCFIHSLQKFLKFVQLYSNFGPWGFPMTSFIGANIEKLQFLTPAFNFLSENYCKYWVSLFHSFIWKVFKICAFFYAFFHYMPILTFYKRFQNFVRRNFRGWQLNWKHCGDLPKNREIRETLYPRKFMPLRYLLGDLFTQSLSLVTYLGEGHLV